MRTTILNITQEDLIAVAANIEKARVLAIKGATAASDTAMLKKLHDAAPNGINEIIGKLSTWGLPTDMSTPSNFPLCTIYVSCLGTAAPASMLACYYPSQSTDGRPSFVIHAQRSPTGWSTHS